MFIKVIHKLIKYNKICDYINLKNIEVRLSLYITIVMFVVMWYFDIYVNFNSLTSHICEGILCIVGALIGVLGILLAGVAFIASLFTPEYIATITFGLKILQKKNKKVKWKTGEEVVDGLMSSFVFLSLHIGLYALYLIIIYFLVSSPASIIPIVQFYVLLFLSVYMLVFTIFYAIALVYNCVDLNAIKTRFYNSYKKEKTFYDKANEIRIDMIIATILSDYEGDKKNGNIRLVK